MMLELTIMKTAMRLVRRRTATPTSLSLRIRDVAEDNKGDGNRSDAEVDTSSAAS
jgi:hypothetical protein